MACRHHCARYSIDALEQHKLTPYHDVISSLALPSLALTTSKDSSDAIGESRLGGTPDLPPGEAWPAEDGCLFTFVAQLKLADLPILPGLDLPRQGLLSFYAGECESAADPGGLVRYYEDAVVPTPVPEDAISSIKINTVS